MNISPKARFLSEEKLAKQFLDVVDSEAFQRASELALVQLIAELYDADIEPAQALGRLRGAHRILEILKSLPEPFKPLPSPRSHNLVHDLK